MSLFVTIVESRSLTAAANQLHLAKSAVSRRLMELEARLGVQLMTRTTRKSSLTEAGRLYYQQANRLLENVEELNDALSQKSGNLTGTLKVAVPLSFGLPHLSPVINKFADLHPDLLIELNFADRQIDLVEEGFDLAIRIANLTDSSLIARRLTTINHVLCASPDYLKKMGTPQSPADLKNHKILRYKSPSGLTPQIIDPNNVAHDLSGQTCMLSNNGEFLKKAAIAGHGIYMTPTFICWEDLKSGALVPVLTDYSNIQLGAYAVYPQTRFLSHRVRQFIDYLADYFGPTPYWDDWMTEVR